MARNVQFLSENMEENDGMEDEGVDAMILICILICYCRREGIVWFHLPLEHMITNLLSHESSEILNMLLASQWQPAVWL